MVGGIYSSELCPQCGARMVDNGRDAVACPAHKRQRAAALYVSFPPGKVFKRFKDYEAAARFLHGLRFKTDEGSFDARDYRRDNPLGFSTLAERYLEVKAQEVKPGTLTHIRFDLACAMDFFGSTNIKEIGYAEIEDFALEQKTVSGKTKANRLANLHAFFMWVARRKVLRRDQIPEFPTVHYALGFRRTITKEVQEQILEEIRQRTIDSPRIYLAFRLLSTYVSMRPGEIVGILESDLDRKKGVLSIRNHKTAKHVGAKVIPLLEEDMEAFRALPQGLPSAPLFRHESSDGHSKVAGEAFGQHMLYKHWRRACKKLGIEGVDMYGGLRHSSCQHYREMMGAEDVKRLTLHTTNKAFDRYLEIGMEELRAGYAKGRATVEPINKRKKR